MILYIYYTFPTLDLSQGATTWVSQARETLSRSQVKVTLHRGHRSSSIHCWSRSIPKTAPKKLNRNTYKAISFHMRSIFPWFSTNWYIHIYGCVWKCCVPLNPLVLLIIIPMKNCYFIGNIPYFQTNPYVNNRTFGLNMWSGSWSFPLSFFHSYRYAGMRKHWPPMFSFLGQKLKGWSQHAPFVSSSSRW